MALIVQKFGGSSLANVDMIKRVASKIIEMYTKGNDLVIILSAMECVTDNLIQLAHEASPIPDKKELDVLLATGEQASVSILAMIIKHMGYKAQSALAYQIGIITNSSYGAAKITSIDVRSIKKIIEDGTIAVIAGFQGCDSYGNITTLGRGGSDTSAVAIAAALKADLCEIYTDVDGVYTADPYICPKAKKFDKISYDDMLCMAGLGTKVLHQDSINIAKKYNITLHVRSSFYFSKKGTIIVSGKSGESCSSILGIAYDLGYSRIMLRGVPYDCDIATKIFLPIAQAGILVDILIQNAVFDGYINLMFTVPKEDFNKTLNLVRLAAEYIETLEVVSSKDNAKISVIGLSNSNNINILYSILKVLKNAGIYFIVANISEAKFSCIVSEKNLRMVVRLLHSTLNLG